MATDPGFVHLHVHSAYSLLEGALTDRQARRTRQGRQAAGAGAHRHRQHVRRAGILRKDGVVRHPADRRLRAGGRFRRRGARSAAQRPRPGVAAHRADRRARGRLSQPDAALLARLPGNAAQREAASQARLARGRERRPDRAHRRARPARSTPRSPRARPSSPRRAARRCRASIGDRLYVELQRHGTAAERAVEPALVGLAYAGGIPLVATNEPFFARREDYDAHDALICIAEGRAGRRDRPPPAHRRALFQEPRRDGGAVRRSAGGARLDRGDRRSAARSGRAPTSRSCRASRSATATSTRRRSCARAPRPGSSAASQRTASRPAAPSRSTASGSPSSSRSSKG